MGKSINTTNNSPFKKLGEVCTYSKGKKPVVLEETKTKDCSVPYINIKAFEKGIISEYTNGEKCNICNDNDLLMVWDGARCGLIGKAKKGAVGSTLMKILPKEIINKEYLYHFISSKFWTLNTKSKGVGIPHIEPTLLWNFELVVPPLHEQQAIVVKIEELLSKLENGKQQLLTAQQQLKVYRQSLLKWAFEGKLTNKNVNEGELPKGWIENEIKNVCSNIKVGIVIKPTNFYSKNGSGIKAFRSANVRELKINNNDWVYFSEEANKINHRTKLKTDDVLLVRSGYPGTSCVVSKEFEGCNAIDILIATPDKEKILSKYLCYFNNSPLGKGLFLSKSRGVAQRHLNVGEYSKLKIHVPSLKEQDNIIQELESKLTVCDKIEETITQSLQQSEILKQSILKKAFEGKLI